MYRKEVSRGHFYELVKKVLLRTFNSQNIEINARATTINTEYRIDLEDSGYVFSILMHIHSFSRN